MSNLVCEPSYTFCLTVSIVLGDDLSLVNLEMQESEYRAWFNDYALCPMTVHQLANDGLLTQPPPHRMCGNGN